MVGAFCLFLKIGLLARLKVCGFEFSSDGVFGRFGFIIQEFSLFRVKLKHDFI
jgi:hypothetical protein